METFVTGKRADNGNYTRTPKYRTELPWEISNSGPLLLQIGYQKKIGRMALSIHIHTYVHAYIHT